MISSRIVGLGLTILLGLSFALISKADDKKAVRPSKEVIKKSAAITTNSSPEISSTVTSSAKVSSVTSSDNKKSWALDLTAEIYPQTNTQDDASIIYVAVPQYVFGGKRHLIEWVQRVNQVVVAEPGKESKVEALNPRFDYIYTFTNPEAKDLSVSLRLRSEIGTTQDADANGLVAINSVRLNFRKSIGDFSFGLRPYFAHYTTRYSTNAKGEAMPLFGVGHNLKLDYKFSSKWSWYLESDNAFRMLQPEEVNVAAALALQQDAAKKPSTDTVRTALYIETAIAYQATSAFAVRLGYAQDDKMLIDGKYAINFLGEATSRYFLGLDYSY